MESREPREVRILDNPDRGVRVWGTLVAEEYSKPGASFKMARMLPFRKERFPNEIAVIDVGDGLKTVEVQYPGFETAILETTTDSIILMRGGVLYGQDGVTLISGNATRDSKRGVFKGREFTSSDILPKIVTIGKGLALPALEIGEIIRATVFGRTFFTEVAAGYYEESDAYTKFRDKLNTDFNIRAMDMLIISGVNDRIRAFANFKKVAELNQSDTSEKRQRRQSGS